MMIFFPEAYLPQSLDLPRDKQYLSSVGYFFHSPFPIWPPLVPGAWKRGAPQPLSAVLMAQHIFIHFFFLGMVLIPVSFNVMHLCP